MAGNFVNPLASVAGYRNQQLAPVVNRQGASPVAGRTAQQSMDAGKPQDTGLSAITQRSAKSHQAFMAALQARKERQQPRVANMSGTGTYAVKGGTPGNPKGLVGRYNLLAGADQALQGLNAAFQRQFGRGLTINSGGRTYAEQARLYDGYRRGLPGFNLAAPPGTSQHESGRALDFGGAIMNAGSREHQWLQQNAGRFGFKWTGKNFKQFEPWHWEWWG